MAVQADIADTEAQRVREVVKRIRPSKKDLRRLGKGNLMASEGILDAMQERDKNREKAANAEKATRTKPSPRPITPVPVRVHPPSRVRFQLLDAPTRILRSATRFVPRLNYSLPPSTASELQDDSDLESLISAASSGNTAPHLYCSPSTERNLKYPSAGYTSSQAATLLQIGYSTSHHRQRLLIGCCCQFFYFFLQAYVPLPSDLRIMAVYASQYKVDIVISLSFNCKW